MIISYLHDIAIGNDNKIFFGGFIANNLNKYYLIETFTETISLHYNMTTSEIRFIVKSDTSYPIVSGNLNNYPLVDYDMTEYTLSHVDDSNYTYQESWVSDVSYWYGNTSDTTELQSSTYYEIDINLTCSVSGNTAITYDLIPNDNDAVPSWVTLDISDRKLKFTTPELDADTNFTFSVEAVVSGDTNTYVNNYYLEVLPVNITNNT